MLAWVVKMSENAAARFYVFYEAVIGLFYKFNLIIYTTLSCLLLCKIDKMTILRHQNNKIRLNLAINLWFVGFILSDAPEMRSTG